MSISQLRPFLKSHPESLLIVLYLVTRLINLSLLPVFSDEALYMEWGWRALHSPGQIWHSLHDAKQPFLMWFFGLGQTVFPDPLFGARSTSVITGLLSLLGLWKIGNRYFDRKIALISLLLYIVLPSFVFFDRQSLMESALSAASIWSLYFLLSLHDRPTLKNTLLLGVSLGLGFFTKNSAALFLLAFLAIQTLYSFRKQFPTAKQASLTLYILIIFITVNLPLFFQPQYWSTLESNARWTFSFTELLAFPISQWITNVIGNLELAAIHITPPLFVFLILGVYQLIRSKKSEHRTILLWFFLPLIPYLLTQRFMNFMIWRYQTPLLAVSPLIIAFALSKIRKGYISLFLSIPLLFSLILIFSPISFFHIQNKITRYSYIDGYVTGMDTGYQVNEIVKFLNIQANRQPIFIGIAVHSFNPESGIWAYFRKTPHAIPSYFDSLLIPPGYLEKVDCLTASRPLYFVAKLNDTAGLQKYLEQVTVITNPHNSDYSTIYTLKKSCTGPTLHLQLEYPINY